MTIFSVYFRTMFTIKQSLKWMPRRSEEEDDKITPGKKRRCRPQNGSWWKMEVAAENRAEDVGVQSIFFTGSDKA